MMELVYVLLTAVVGGLGFWRWRNSAPEKIKRALRNAARWPIAELPENTHGRIVGAARAVDEPLIAPLSGRPCVYYIVNVLMGHKGEIQILREERGVPFIVEDDTGRALIDPRDCAIELQLDAVTDSGPRQEPTPAQRLLLERHSHEHKASQLLSYRESVIEIGESVAVLGSGVREADPDGEPGVLYRGAPTTRLRLTSSAKYPLIISDHRTTTG